MNKLFTKFIASILSIILSINFIFPCFVFAYDRDDIEDHLAIEVEELEEAFTAEDLAVIKAKVQALIDYKISKKIPSIISESKMEQEAADKELLYYLNTYLSLHYDVLKEMEDGYASEGSLYDWDYTDETSKRLAKEIHDYMVEHHTSDYREYYIDDYALIVVYDYLESSKVESIKMEMDSKYFPPQVEIDLDTFEQELGQWLDQLLAEKKTDKEKAAFLLAFFDEWFLYVRQKFDLSGTVLDGLTITEDVDDLKKIKAHELSLADYYTKSKQRLISENNLYLSEKKDQILLAYYALLMHVANVVLDRFPDDIDVEDVDPEEIVKEYVVSEPQTVEEDDEEYYETSGISGILDTVLGFLTYLYKMVFLVPGLLVNYILSSIASVGGTSWEFVTFEDIIFNRVALLDVNVLSPTTTANGEAVSGVITEIRINIAGWYVAFRNLAITVSFATLIYIGIRMAIESSGDKRARYKQMLIYWATGFALIFVLHYIINIVLMINTSLVNMFATSQKQTGNFANILLTKAFEVSLVKSWGAAIMYTVLLVITLIFLIIYIKRMLMTCFLVMIAPLITISYSIDKIGNNRSEILNQWLKEFCYNVLIQPFHCIVYVVFVSTAVTNLNDVSGLQFGKMIESVVYLLLLFIGEKLIRQIFGFTKSQSVSSKLFSGAMITQAVKDVKQIRDLGRRNDSEDDELTEMPALMPDGTPTSQTMISTKTVKNGEEAAGETPNAKGNAKGNVRGNASGTQTGSPVSTETVSTGTSAKRTKMRETMRKIQDKTPVALRDVGQAYVGGIKTVTGVSAAQGFAQRRKEKQAKKGEMSRFRSQFLYATEVYARQNGLSKRNLNLKIEELRNTSMDKLTNNSDRVYKLWVDKMDKDLVKGGAKNRNYAMRDFIDSKYSEDA